MVYVWWPWCGPWLYVRDAVGIGVDEAWLYVGLGVGVWFGVGAWLDWVAFKVVVATIIFNFSFLYLKLKFKFKFK